MRRRGYNRRPTRTCPDRIHNTDGQPLAHFYSRGSEAEARRAMMLTKDEARRIAVKVTRLPEPLGKAAGGPREPRRASRRGSAHQRAR
jgi:hypothetical protein